MSMKRVFAAAVVLALVVAMILPTGAAAESNVIHVYEGDSIQTAIDGASEGDIIKVHPGIYLEVVVVDKNISLKGINQPIVNPPEGVGPAITVTADGVSIQGFHIIGSAELEPVSGPYLEVFPSTGILVLADDCIVRDNVIENWQLGIDILGSGNLITGNEVNSGLNVLWGVFPDCVRTWPGTQVNTIAHNECFNSTHGIVVWGDSSTVEHNKVHDVGHTGILTFWVDSYDNTIAYNVVYGSDGPGIALAYSHGNWAHHNRVFDNVYGMSTSGFENTIEYNVCQRNSTAGLWILEPAHENIFIRNKSMNGDGWGFMVLGDNNTFLSNIALNNVEGALNDTGVDNTYIDNKFDNGGP